MPSETTTRPTTMNNEHQPQTVPIPEGKLPQMDDEYDPSVYRCTGYDVNGYVWFDGDSDAEDRRFLIDLENGTMDRLPDVRPYLYHVGFCAGDRSKLDIDKWDPSHVEDHFVKAGREFLAAEWGRGLGYFLADRVWPEKYRDNMPFQCALHFNGRLPGDVGLIDEHPPDAEDCVEGSIIKTNLRPPLPDISVAKVLPGDPRWDLFIQWLYTCQIHPLVGFIDCHWNEEMIQQERHTEGYLSADFFLYTDMYDTCRR